MNEKLSIKAILEKYKKEVKKISGDNLKKAVLYGSRARKQADRYSDIDILLIFEKEPAPQIKSKIRQISNQISLEHDVVIAEILFTQSDFQKYQTPFLLNVKREGIAL